MITSKNHPAAVQLQRGTFPKFTLRAFLGHPLQGYSAAFLPDQTGNHDRDSPSYALPCSIAGRTQGVDIWAA